tara:strand:+ start:704 stop:1198 length:495 start_codon:yes stop_codon:yes gene_type:complete
MAEIINNYLSPTNFTISVQRIPNVEFFTQKMVIPGIQGTPVAVDNPLKAIYQQNDKLVYSDLELTMILDENMNNYKEILNWMEGIAFPEETKQHKDLAKSTDGLYSDIIATITNSHKNPNIRFTFTNCFPVSLGSINLDVDVSDVSYATCGVTMRFDSMKMEQL